MKNVIWSAIGVILIMVLAAANYLGYFKKEIPAGQDVVVADSDEDGEGQGTTTQKYRIERVVEGLEVPWSVVFTDDNRMLITERKGNIRLVEYGILRSNPLHTFSDVASKSEEGLMGMALDPEYAKNKFVYVCYAYGEKNSLKDKVVRLKDEGEKLTEEKILIDNIPAAQYHAGCRIAFGPDNKLYVTTGDATDKKIAQDVQSLGGKILRINNDGSIPDDNPFGNSAVYSLGHRNPQGITWHPESGVLVSTEHGPSGFDGPGGGDEINRIEKGKNYGWPLVSHNKSQVGLVAPLIQFTPAVAPGSALIYSGDVFKDWRGVLFFGGLKGEGVYMVNFTNNKAEAIKSYQKLDINVGRVREVMQGPDGYIYFSSSNRDGRGKVRGGDDVIYRIVPAE